MMMMKIIQAATAVHAASEAKAENEVKLYP
jgi:hypothetical protein